MRAWWVKKNISSIHKNTISNGILYLKGGDSEENSKEFPQGIKEFLLSDFFEEEYFVSKKIIYIPVK